VQRTKTSLAFKNNQIKQVQSTVL